MTAYVLNIKIHEMNDVIQAYLKEDWQMSDEEISNNLMAQLRQLTLGYGGGMMTQMLRFQRMKRDNQSINARAVVGYMDNKPIAWALFSKEKTMTTSTAFVPEDGYLVYIFTHREYRRMGIGTKILAKCKELAGNEKLCVCPWEKSAALFFYNNKQKDLFNALEYKQAILGEEHENYF